MKRFAIVLGAIALAVCLATSAYAKGHAAGQSGIATLTLVLRSSAGSSAPQMFHITVKP